MIDVYPMRDGFTLRLDSSGATILKGNYGRFYGKLATSMFNLHGSQDSDNGLIKRTRAALQG